MILYIEKEFSVWTNNGSCEALDQKRGCGSGQQHQVRSCSNGTLEKCIESDTKRVISCKLHDCLKEFGNWTNIGTCKALGNFTTCGPGIQNQSRKCMDGIKSICSDTDTKRNISCREANTTLPECGKCLCSTIPDNKINKYV